MPGSTLRRASSTNIRRRFFCSKAWAVPGKRLRISLPKEECSGLILNYSGRDVAWYLDYALRQSRRVGLYAHYSETHDNNRLAERGRAWSLMRNQLCALTSVSGAYGF